MPSTRLQIRLLLSVQIAACLVGCSASPTSNHEDPNGGNAGNRAQEGGANGQGGQGGGSAGTGGVRSGGQSGGTKGDTGTGGVTPTGGAGGSKPSATGGVGGIVSGPAAPGCMQFDGIVRDFDSTHPDFYFPTCANCVPMKPLGSAALVEETLGSEKKPVLKPAGAGLPAGIAQSIESFNEWFRTKKGVNVELPVKLSPTKLNDTNFEIGPTNDDGHFFPIDGQGLGNIDIKLPDVAPDALWVASDEEHNQLLTLEMHTELLYQGGKLEKILIDADDDAWLFINGKLALDVGGLHGYHAGPVGVVLDEVASKLGLEAGKKYPVSIFFADRQLLVSKFRLISNVIWTGCAKTVP